MRAIGEHGMPPLMAGRAFLEQDAAARRAGVIFIGGIAAGRKEYLAECPPSPEQEAPGADLDGVITYRAEEPLIGLQAEG
jgi:hypothetical protein